jgi:hypothetical protein
VTITVRLDAVGKSGRGYREQSLARQVTTTSDVECDNVVRPSHRILPGAVDRPAVADIQDRLVGRKRQAVWLVKAVGDYAQLSRPRVVAIDKVTQLRLWFEP